MTILWLLLGSLGLMCGMTVIMSVATHAYLRRFPETQPAYFMGGVLLTILVFIMATYTAFYHDLFCPVLGLSAAVFSLLFLQLRETGLSKEVLFLCISLLSSLCLPTDLPLFQKVPVWIGYIFSGTVLYLITRIFSVMDRVPWMSVLTLFAQGILLLFLIQLGTLPRFLVYPLFLALVGAITIAQTIRVFSGRLILGEFAALVVGFMLGILWMFIVAEGYWLLPIITFSYDILEIMLAFISSCVITRSFSGLAVPFLIERAFETGINTKKLVRGLFFILVLLSLIGFVSLGEAELKNILFFVVIILLGAYLRFKQWGIPQPKFKDLGRDLKAGLIELKKQLQYIPLKKDSPKAKVKRKRK